MGVRVCECLRVLDCNDADEEWSISIWSTRAADDTASNNALYLRRYDLLCLDIVRSKATRLKNLHSTLLTNVGWLSQSSQVQSRLSNSALRRYRRLMLAMLHNTRIKKIETISWIRGTISSYPSHAYRLMPKAESHKKKQQTQIIHYRCPEIKYSNIKLQRREKRNSSPRMAISICSFCLCYFFERIFC